MSPSCRISRFAEAKKRREAKRKKGVGAGGDVLLIHKGRDMSIGLLRALEQLVAREAEQHLRVDRVCAHERLVVRQCVWRLGDDGHARLAQRGVGARGAGGAG